MTSRPSRVRMVSFLSAQADHRLAHAMADQRDDARAAEVMILRLRSHRLEVLLGFRARPLALDPVLLEEVVRFLVPVLAGPDEGGVAFEFRGGDGPRLRL